MWKYYEIIQLSPENQKKIEKISGIAYKTLRSEAINRILNGIMPNKTSNILYFAKKQFNKALREKNINVRVI